MYSIQAGNIVRFRPEYCTETEKKLLFVVANVNTETSRVLITCINSGLSIAPTETVSTDMMQPIPDISETAIDIINSGLYYTAVSLMDDSIRESVHADIAPCSEYDFLSEYMFRHLQKYGEPFTI